MSRWCECPNEWEEVLQLSLKDDLTADDKKRLKELRKTFWDKEIQLANVGIIYDVFDDGELVLQSPADIVAEFVGMTNEIFHSKRRYDMDKFRVFNGFTVRYSELTTEEYTERISASIGQIVIDFDMTASDFSALLGIPQTTLSSWIRGERKPSASGVVKIAKLTGLTIPEVIDGTGVLDEEKIDEAKKNTRCFYDIIDDDGNIILQAPLSVTARALGVDIKTLHAKYLRAKRLGLKINGYRVEMSEITSKEYFVRINSMIDEYITKFDITLNEFLKIIDIAPVSYRRWRNYEAVPKLFNLLKISDQLGVSVFDLVRGSKWDKEV